MNISKINLSKPAEEIIRMNDDDFNSMADFYQQILCYFLIPIQLFGLIGNPLAFAVFTRKRFEKVSFAFYYKVMAFTDTIVLIHSFNYWLSSFFKAGLPNMNQIFCKFTEFLQFVASSSSIFILSLIAFDRMLTIVFSQRFKTLREKKFQIFLVSCGLICCVGAYVVVPLTTYLRVQTFFNPFANTTFVFKMCTYDLAVVKMVNIVTFTIETPLVLFVSNTFTAITIIYIFKSRRKFRNMSAANHSLSNQRSASRDRKFAINSIALNLLSLVCKSPYLIFLNLASTHSLNSVSDQFYLIYQQLGILLFILDNACSFFVNMLVNSMFYEEFLVMVRLRKEENNQHVNRPR